MLDFNKILPFAVQWAKEQETLIIEKGVSLMPELLDIAGQMGVSSPEKVRLLLVDKIPIPDDSILREACKQTQLISEKTAGLTLRYGIFIRSDYSNNRQLIAHELAHVAQYEKLGGIQQFLQQYLYEVMTIGYPQAPMEQEAINKENLIT